MKVRHLLPASLLTATAALVFTSHGELERKAPVHESPVSSPVSAMDNSQAIARMDAEKVRIASRLKISTPMEIENFNGVDPVMEAYDSGFIIEATLEQVEAAIAAAAKTPGREDDLAAEELRHRGSYRFFSPDAKSTASAKANP